MASTKPQHLRDSGIEWRADGLRYYTLSYYLRRRFGCRVWKVSVDGGFSCPNVDGSIGTGGCVFCNLDCFSPSRRIRSPCLSEKTLSIAEQIRYATMRLRGRYRAEAFLAYFQPATNTYAPVETLRALYEEAIGQPGIVGLCIGTRPDCVPDPVLNLLAELSRRTWVSVEFGLQSVHDRTLDWMNRGHHFDAVEDAVARSRQRGLRVGVHVILGLPGETRSDMLATAEAIGKLQVASVKLHNLHVVRQSRLAEQWAAGQTFPLLSREEYCALAVDFLECLPPTCVIDRLCADAPREFLLAPDWCLDKSAVTQAIRAELQRRDTWQGRRFTLPTAG